MKTVLTLLVTVSVISCSPSSNDVTPRVPIAAVYKNGDISTGNISNSGQLAPAGYSWSELQNNVGDNSISNQAMGFSTYYNSSNNYIGADDFTIPAGQTWDISKISIYASISMNASNVSPFDALRVQIWKGHPSDNNSTSVFGDMTTNVLTTAVDSLIYLIENSSVPSPGVTPNANTKVWKLTANANLQLGPGHYWLTWQVHSISGTANFSPAAKIKGKRGLNGWNAHVFQALNIWQPIRDIGKPTTMPMIAQDLPFEIEYKY